MKNRIKIPMVFVTLLLFAFFLNGCVNNSGNNNSGDHSTVVHTEHSYSSEYHFDSTRHYRVCECGATSDIESHVEADNNPGVCIVCGYVIYEMHTVTVITDTDGLIRVDSNTLRVKHGDSVTITAELDSAYRLILDGEALIPSDMSDNTLRYTIVLSMVSADTELTLSCEFIVCEHIWLDSDCLNPIRCSECGMTVRDPLGHKMVDATCDEASHCQRCEYTEGTSLGHSMTDATCEEASHCQRCEYTEGTSLGHSMTDATCDEASHCQRCEYTEGTSLGHSMTDATCDEAPHCQRCEYTEGTSLGHSMTDATCDEASHCQRCEYTEGTSLGHSMTDATCDEASHCQRCEYTEGTPLDHKWSEATCINKSTCELCGTSTGELGSHSYTSTVVPPQCMSEGYTRHICSICENSYNDSYKDATGHSGGEKNLGICEKCGDKYMDIITYCTYGGAVGDGITDDFEAIRRTHERANITGQTVVADPGKTFYLGQHTQTITIMTDTIWTDATFIIDDSSVSATDPVRTYQVFNVAPSTGTRNISEITSLKPGQSNIGIKLGSSYLIKIVNDNVKQYIRYGANADSGDSQQEIILVDKDGNVDPSTPIMWNYDAITSMVAFSADDTPITITGGHFITIANAAPRRYTYYNRGISITRSNVTIVGLKHTIEGEGDTGAPYGGFINIANCTNILLDSLVLTGHKVYKLETDVNNSMGTYDISFASANNITCLNCSQTNSITDTAYWGIMGSNYCKNLTYDGCVFSRFDAHKGTYNATIINSEIGHQKVSIIGSGTMIIENTVIHGNSIVALRSDYGSTWQGDVIIRNVTLNNTGLPVLISAEWYNHDFGYTCYLPEKVTIEGIKIAKGTYFYVLPNLPTGVDQPTISSGVNKNPYVLTKSITVSGLPAGNTCYVSINMTLFASVRLTMK